MGRALTLPPYLATSLQLLRIKTVVKSGFEHGGLLGKQRELAHIAALSPMRKILARGAAHIHTHTLQILSNLISD